MASQIRSKHVYFLFVAGLWLPLLATLLSPQIGVFVSQTWQHPAAFDEALNRLRQKTPLWNGAVSLYNRTLYLAGTSGRPGAAEAGRFGWMFLGDLFNNNFSQALGRRVLGDDEVVRWTETLRLQSRWLADRHIGNAFIVAPAKWSIYPDHLPWWTRGWHPAHSLDRILARSAGTLPLIDLRPALIEARQHVDTYSALDSHWTGYGAYVAWTQIAEALAHLLPNLPDLAVPVSRGASVIDSHNEFAGMLGLSAPNAWTNYILENPMHDVEFLAADGSAVPLAGGSATDLLDLPRTTRNESASNRLRVLVLRDSTGNGLSPFLQNAFYMTYQIDHRLGVPGTWPNLPGLVEKFHPDLVLWVMTERYLNEPLGDIDYWKTAIAYDCIGRGDDWPRSASGQPLAVHGDFSPSSPLQVAVPAATQSQVMRLSLHAATEGVLVVADSTRAVNLRLRYGTGHNELFMRLAPSATDSVTTVNSESGAGPDLDGVGLRAIDDSCVL